MTQKRRASAHRRKLDDPLVPVSGTLVRAALKVAQTSERKAVQALEQRGIRTAQTTLDHIVHGRQKRCRASLREGLESLLGVPRGRLGGDYREPQRGRDLNQRARSGSAIGKAIAKVRKNAGIAVARGLLDPSLSATPLYELLADRLVYDIARASRKRLSPLDEEDLGQLVGRVLSLDLWRRWLFTGPASRIIEPEEMDRFAQAMGDVLRVALRPWIERRKLAIRQGRLQRLQAALDRVSGDVARDVAPTAAQTGARDVPEGREPNPAPVFNWEYLKAQEAELAAGEEERRAELEARKKARSQRSRRP